MGFPGGERGDRARLLRRGSRRPAHPLRLLLDTNVVLWALVTPARLRAEVQSALEEPSNEVFVSAVTPWEIAIKEAKGQLVPPADLLVELRRQHFVELRVTWEHGAEAGALPPHHRDPFDRLLVAQARLEELAIVTADPAIVRYEVAVVPA